MANTSAQAYYKNEIEDRTGRWEHWTRQSTEDLGALADSIVAGAVVAYVGAGPSIASGTPDTKQIPGWKELCTNLFEWAKKDVRNLLRTEDFEYLQELINKDNFPLFCQLLDNAYRDDRRRLEDYLKRLFSTEGIEPSEAYRAIAMLPISLRLTTNYEDLLERAIHGLGPAYRKTTPRIDSLTWKDGARMLDLVRSGHAGVVKIHGHISGHDSKEIVLTKNHYRQLSSDSAFWDVLKTLLSTRTFLFIGCSMSDPDIFALLDEVIEEFRLLGEVSPSEPERPPLHYALLSRDARKPAFVRHLRDDYRIATLPVPDGPDGRPDLTPLLREISGAVAERTQPTLRQFSPFFDDQTPEARLSEIVRTTGSERGDIVLQGEGRELKYWFNWDWHLPNRDKDPEKRSKWRDNPPQTGVIAASYVEPVDFEYAPYLPHDGTAAARGGALGGAPGSGVQTRGSGPSDFGPYFRWDDQSRSELAVPIIARGHRIGVLNVESYFPDAYSTAHRKFLQKQAEVIGALRLEAEERDRTVREIKAMARRDGAGQAVLIEKLRQLYSGADELQGILYTPSFANGELTGYCQALPDPIVHHPFRPEPSFAKTVFLTREFYLEPDAGEAIRENRIDVRLAEQVGLKKGPIFGCQVFDRELMCAVLVLWARQDRDEPSFAACGLSRPDRQTLLATAANLIVAGRGRSDTALAKVLQQIRALSSASSEAEAYAKVAQAAEALGLKRVRIWRRRETFAEIVYAWPPSYAVVGVKETWIQPPRGDALQPSEEPEYSPYCSAVCGRYETDPWARLQGPNVFNLGDDPVGTKLLRPKRADWIVAPVVIGIGDKNVKHTDLWGYLGTDIVSEELQNDLDADASNFEYPERNWMECGMSVVAVALSSAMRELQPEAGRAARSSC